VSRVTAAFTFSADASFLAGGNIRAQADGDPLGCVGDLGTYCVRFALAAFGYRSPRAVRAVRVRRNAHGVPMDASAEVYWPEAPAAGSAESLSGRDSEGRPVPTLSLHCSFLHPFRQTAEVVGTGDATLTVRDFVIRRVRRAKRAMVFELFHLYRPDAFLRACACALACVCTRVIFRLLSASFAKATLRTVALRCGAAPGSSTRLRATKKPSKPNPLEPAFRCACLCMCCPSRGAHADLKLAT
jgi:hypothetical protein